MILKSYKDVQNEIIISEKEIVTKSDRKVVYAVTFLSDLFPKDQQLVDDLESALDIFDLYLDKVIEFREAK